MRGVVAFFAKCLTGQFSVVTHTVCRLFFPTEETTFGVLGAAISLRRVADVIVADASITTGVGAGGAFGASHRTVLTFGATALMATAGAGVGFVGDGAKRTTTTPFVFFAALSVKATVSAEPNMAASQAKAYPLVLACTNFHAVTVAGHHLAGTRDGFAGPGLGAFKQGAMAVGASSTTFARSVVITSSTGRSGVQGTGAAITRVGALIIGQAGVDTEVAEATETFGASLDGAGAIVLAKVGIEALTVVAERSAAALACNAGLTIVATRAMTVLCAGLTGQASRCVVTSRARGA